MYPIFVTTHLAASVGEATAQCHTYRILETKEHHLHLVDAVAVKVQLQLQLRQCSGYDFPVSGPHKLSEARDEGRDVFPL